MPEPEARLQEMIRDLEKAPPEILPSRYWEELNSRNLRQLREQGYENFKRTVARNYFTWLVAPFDGQIKFLRRHLPWTFCAATVLRTLFGAGHPPLTWKQSRAYSLLTRLLWEYARREDPEGLLDRLREPEEGNPPRVFRDGRLISQDLANSLLEYRSIVEPLKEARPLKTVLELGPGYGRTAYVFLSLMPGLRYVLVDIPPALYLAERYLSSVLPGRRVFPYRPFESFEEVLEEFERSEIAFLLPHQMGLLPPRSADLVLNISSLHEMRIEQIRYYFRHIERLAGRYFYFKQWRESNIPNDNVTIREADYPVPAAWKKLYWRPCRVQDSFFEAMFEC